MARRFTLIVSVLLLAGVPVPGQIIIPGGGYPGGGYPGGGYPGGGYPGGGYPGRRYPQGPNGPGQTRRDDQPSTTTLTGILRKIEDKQVIVESDDKSITTAAISGSTKFAGPGGSAKIGDFQPGDHVTIEAKQDDKKAWHAHKITLEKEGTTDEHAIASQAMDDPARPLPDNFPGRSSTSASSSGSSSSSSGGGDHPTLRRAASSSDNSVSSSSAGNAPSGSTSDSSDRPVLRRASSSSDSTSSSSDNNNYDPNRPVLRRAPASSDTTASSSASNSSSPSDDPDRPIFRRSPSSSNAGGGSSSSSASSNYPSSNNSPSNSSADTSGDAPPRMRRAVSNPDGGPQAEIGPAGDSSSASGSTIASARPGRAPVSDPDARSGDSSYPGLRIPQRSSQSADPVIDQARESAFSFTETLPNYVVKQYTTRYATNAARGGRTSWETLDNVSADVIEEDGSEKYKNILVNGKPPKEDVEKSGSWSRGEYSSLQLDVLSPLTNADFHGKRATTIVNRAAYRYDFNVQQPNSHWHVESGGQSYMPAYSGSIWIDKENYRVLRIELAAQDVPRSFPLDTVESAVDYDYVYIGESKYLLPVHSEALSCARGTNECSRNVIEFRNYRKFTSETSITFDDK